MSTKAENPLEFRGMDQDRTDRVAEAARRLKADQRAGADALRSAVADFLGLDRNAPGLSVEVDYWHESVDIRLSLLHFGLSDRVPTWGKPLSVSEAGPDAPIAPASSESSGGYA